jgi:hypothetical protein
MRRFLTLLLSAFCVALVSGQGRTTLDIYVIDVEGGNATLFVAPSGQSLLIDTGNGGAAARRRSATATAFSRPPKLPA